MTSAPLSPAGFRELFPALRSTVWLDTPGSPPGARPVTEALHDAVSAWSSGEFDWTSWDGAAAESRTRFAHFTGVDPGTVSTLGSLAEAAPAELAADAGRCDASPAWFSWVGAGQALRLLGSLDTGDVERHCLGLAERLTEDVRRLGLRRVTGGPPSHIAVFRTDRADHIAARLREHHVRATALGDRVRFGFHYFNDESDVSATVRALA